MPATTDLDGLGLDTGGHLLVEQALATLPPGDQLTVTGRHPALSVHLAAWCRAQGHRFDGGEPPVITKGRAGQQRWHGAVRAGDAPGPPRRTADQRWGLAARGALVEAGGPPIGAEWADRDHVWADIAPKLYAAAAAAQWDPAAAVDWSAAVALPAEVERAVVQVMTYLVENEQAALIIPARLLTAHAARADLGYLGTLRQAVERRHAALLDTAGLNSEVFDALVVLAAGSWEPEAISRGWHSVQRLQRAMDEGRRRRLAYIGFPADEAAELSALHTRNFM